MSGEVITENGHAWVGIDISPAMLSIAREREADGDLVLGDIGAFLPFRSGSFDGAVSISAVQWLFNSERADHNPLRRIRTFFASLYACLSRGARAVLQCYPESTQQLDLLQTEAVRAGFTGGLVVDFPNSTRAKKWVLHCQLFPSSFLNRQRCVYLYFLLFNILTFCFNISDTSSFLTSVSGVTFPAPLQANLTQTPCQWLVKVDYVTSVIPVRISETPRRALHGSSKRRSLLVEEWRMLHMTRSTLAVNASPDSKHPPFIITLFLQLYIVFSPIRYNVSAVWPCFYKDWKYVFITSSIRRALTRLHWGR